MEEKISLDAPLSEIKIEVETKPYIPLIRFNHIGSNHQHHSKMNYKYKEYGAPMQFGLEKKIDSADKR